jgi:hypothetical protein
VFGGRTMHRGLGASRLCLGVAIAATCISLEVVPSLASTPQATATKRVPALAGKRLDVAELLLRQRGLRWREVGGGVFGILVKANWVVCSTLPRRGARVGNHARITLIVDRAGYC